MSEMEKNPVDSKQAVSGLMPIEVKNEIMKALAIKPESDEFGMMDSYDEMQIVSDIHQSISDDILKAWVYETRGGGKEITYNAVRHWSNVRTQKGFPIEVNEATQIDFADKIREILDAHKAGLYDDKEAKEKLSFYSDNLFIQVKATDVVTKQARLGFAEQPIREKGKVDPFAFRKACGKAQRNALKEFMTAEEKAAIIFMAETQGKPAVKLRPQPLNQGEGKITTSQAKTIRELADDEERINRYLARKGHKYLKDLSYHEAKTILATLNRGD